jgi:hypothetical protein
MEKRLETTVPDTLIEVEVSYNKGGTTLATMMGYADGPEKRGYWLHVRRLKIERYTGLDGEPRSSTMFALGDGLKVLLLEVKRQSPKAAAEAERLGAGREQEVVNAFLAKKGIQLKTKEVA